MAKTKEKERKTFKEYLMEAPAEVKVISNDEFEIVVGTDRVSYADTTDYAAMHLIQNARFRVHRNGTLEVLSYKNDKPEYMDDRMLMLACVLKGLMNSYIEEFEFSPESFAKYVRYVMRPISKSDCPKNRRTTEKMIKNR